jgi:hypothetical protein
MAVCRALGGTERWDRLTRSPRTLNAAIPTPFLIVLVLWLAILFAGFGLVTARTFTVVAILFVCALSGAILLILELNNRYRG